MKKIFALISILTCSVSLYAQKYLEVYHDGTVIGSMMATDIDSVRVTGDDNSSRRIHFYAAGMEKAFSISGIDSIKVNRSGDESFVYLGVVGFNQALYDMPIDILATSTSSRYSSFVNNLMRKDGTLLYYGVEHALDLLSQHDFTTPLTSVNLITFTDGLDQGSLMMNSSYSMDGDYLNALNQRIGSSVVRGIPITAYSLGLRGNDVSDYTQFRANLQQLATDESNAIEVTSMYDVQNRLQEIAEQIISISHRQNVSAKIPGTSNGTRIRFTFDGSSPEYSSLFIEGTFNLSDRSLRDVTYHGIRSTSGSVVHGEQDGIFVTFTFSNLYRIDGNGLIPMGYIRQYNQTPSSDTWQRNSEFTPDNNTQTSIAHSGAAIMLVLDCSSSLGSQFSNMQSYARDFISKVSNNAMPFNIETPQNVYASLELQDTTMVIGVRWDAVKNAEYYTIYKGSNPYSYHSNPVADSIISCSWIDTTPNTSDGNYYLIEAKGHGISSSLGRSNGRAYCLNETTNVIASLDDDRFAITVRWDDVPFAEGYYIWRNGYFKDSVETTSWKDEKPYLGDNYYSVRAYGHKLTGYYGYSNKVNCSLGTPENVKAESDDGLSINVSWDAVKYAEFYQVYRSIGENGSYILVADSLTTLSWRDYQPGYGTLYYNCYKVIARVHNWKSEMSDSVKAIIEYVVIPDNNVEIDVNGVRFSMVKVDGGTFMMGKDNYATPVHQVTLSDYYIGETEVTKALWIAVMGSNPYSDQLPKEYLSWNDCQTFIAKLNELTGKTFRLPTEAEWEFAARGGNASLGYIYSGSNDVDSVAWHDEQIHAVATKAPNELGIYDMSGNVWEWCQDTYSKYSSEPQINPIGSSTFANSNKIIRGGGYKYFDYYHGNWLDVYSRNYEIFDTSYTSCMGLRLAMTSFH